ncbi:MAG: SH3 domain-containing protein [Clostridia bacterium]|nr:SH3 domain-containing protein [Clostridia bacterium]
MKTVKTAILAIVFLILFSITSFGAEGIVTASSLKLRKEPSLEGEVLYGISKDAKVEILEKTDDKWYKVKYKGDTGYVSAEYIKTAEAVSTPEPADIENTEVTEQPTETLENKIYKTSDELDVYILPVINSSIINKLNAEIQVNVIKIINKWAYVEAESIYGWVIYDKLVTEIKNVVPEPDPEPIPEVTPVVTPQVTEETTATSTPVPEVTEEPTQTQEKVGYINVSTYANLRKEPSTDSTVLDTLQRNTKVTILSEENGWNKVKVNGIIGFVSKNLISSTKLEELDTTSRGTSETREPEKTVQEQPIVQTSTNGEQIVDYAKKYLGYKYVYGGTTPSGGFDCSGFVYYIFGQIGKKISRSLSVQATAGVEVSKANLQIGDIVIFNDSNNSSLGHVGIYIGDNQFIHAANPKRGVVIDYLDSRNSYYNERYVTARRV